MTKITSLPKIDRNKEIWKMFDKEGHTQKEIAEYFRISCSRVWQILKRHKRNESIRTRMGG